MQSNAFLSIGCNCWKYFENYVIVFEVNINCYNTTRCMLNHMLCYAKIVKNLIENKVSMLKNILPLLSRISIVTLEKIVPCHPYKFLLSLKESSTQIQDRFPRLLLADLFKKSLQINISPRR